MKFHNGCSVKFFYNDKSPASQKNINVETVCKINYPGKALFVFPVTKEALGNTTNPEGSQFSRFEGRKLALAKALKESSFDKRERRLIWMEYFIKTSKTNIVQSIVQHIHKDNTDKDKQIKKATILLEDEIVATIKQVIR